MIIKIEEKVEDGKNKKFSISNRQQVYAFLAWLQPKKFVRDEYPKIVMEFSGYGEFKEFMHTSSKIIVDGENAESFVKKLQAKE